MHSGPLLHELFEKQTARRSGNLALEFGRLRLTYGELNHAATRVAERLRACGIRRGERVAVLLERGPRCIAALLGILKAGAAFVPLDEGAPRVRLRHMLSGSGTALVLAQADLAPTLYGTLPRGIPTIVIEEIDFDPETVAEPARGRDGSAATADLAYVIHTSGSTGRPKGVLVEHAAIVNTVLALVSRYHVSESSRVLQFANLTFDASLAEIFPTLAAGGTLVIAPPDQLKSLDGLSRILADRRVTHLTLTPSLLRHLRLPRGCRLETLVCAGDVCPLQLPGRFRGQVGHFINAYGPTECSICVTTYEVRYDETDTIPIGKPLPNTSVFVLDGELREVTAGSVGMLFVAGAGLARGYCGDGTAEAVGPFMKIGPGGERFYETGDLVYAQADGNLCFVGRKDNQVKVRGLRINLSEIDVHIQTHPQVVDSVTVVPRCTPEDERIVCYYRGPAPVPVQDLVSHLRTKLPSSFVPNHFVFLDRLPVDTNGKVDRRSLPPVTVSPDCALPLPREGDEISRCVAEIWLRILRRNDLAPDDDFFELGGDSLGAMQVVAQVDEQLGVDLDVATLFEDSTFGAFVDAVRSKNCQMGERTRALCSSGGQRGILSPAQEMFWFSFELDPTSPVNNVFLAVEIVGPLEPAALREAMAVSLARHGSLRTVFRRTDSGVARVIRPETTPLLEVVDLSEGGRPATPAAIRLAAERWILRTFDLTADCLFTGHIVKADAERWILVFVTHHIVADGHSLQSVVSEILGTYGCIRLGLPVAFPRLAGDFGAYAEADAANRKSDAALSSERYWSELFVEIPAPLDLPFDGPRPLAPTASGDVLVRELNPILSAEVRTLARDLQATPFAVLLAAFLVYLHRLCGRETLTVGTPASTRDGSSLDGVVGVFINTLPIKSQMPADVDFRTFAMATLGRVSNGLSHKRVPFRRIVDLVNPSRGPNNQPLFNVMFDYLEAWVPPRPPGLQLSEFPLWSKTAKFDLTLSVTSHPTRFRLAYEYDACLFREETVSRFARSFEALLQACLREPSCGVMCLPIMAPEERALLVGGLQGAATGAPVEAFAACFERQVSATPDAAAVVHGDAWITYRQLDERSSTLAKVLCSHGVSRDRLVSIFLDRSIETVVAIIATWKARGAYIPIEPSHPAARVAAILEQARPRVVVTAPQFLPLLPEMAGAPVAIDVKATPSRADSSPASDSPGLPDDLAYVIFTSGSTGKPKGAMIEQAGMMNHLRSMIRALGLGPNSTVAQNAPFGFDVSVWQFVGVLLAGGRVVIFDRKDVLDPRRFLEHVQRDEITVLEVVPSFLSSFFALEDAAGGPPTKLPHLRHLITTGETIQPRLVRRWFAQFPEVPVVNAYGPAEASDDTALHFIHVAPGDGLGTVPIGRPLENVRMYIVDDHLNLCPIGVKGELCVGGVAVGRGYLNDPEGTARSFVRDPFTPTEGIMYRTGDVGRWTAAGELEFFGRKDHQVKIRGARIELEEIEHQIRQHPRVREAVVVASDLQHPGGRLVAFYSTTDNRSCDDLRTFLAESLPQFMIPNDFVHLQDMPRGATEKIDRTTLATWSREHLLGERRPGPLEGRAAEAATLLMDAWRKALGIQSVGLDDNFFELGGDSLAAVAVVIELLQRGVRASVSDMLRHQTIRGLAARLGRPGTTEAVAEPLASSFPCAPMQQWFFDQQFAKPNHYNQAITADIGPVDVPVLAQALAELQSRHAALRLRFPTNAGSATVQRYADDLNVPLHVVDLADEATVAADTDRHLAALQASMDITVGPVFAAALFRSPSVWRLVLVAHHLVVDAVSWTILLNDLEQLCRNPTACHPVSPGAATLPYDRWIDRLRRLANDNAVLRELPYWVEILGSEPTAWPVKLDGGDHAGSSGIVSATLSAERTAVFRRLAMQGRVDLSEALLLVPLVRVLARWAGRDAVRLSLERHGREDIASGAGVVRTVGWFTSCFPVRLALPAGSSSREQLQAVYHALATVPNKGRHFGALRYYCSHPGAAPLREASDPDVVFNYLGFHRDRGPGSLLGTAQLMRTGLIDDANVLPHLLEIDCLGEGEHLVIEWRYHERAVGRTTVEGLFAEYLRELLTLLEEVMPGDAAALQLDGLEVTSIETDRLRRICATWSAQDGFGAVEDVLPLSPMQEGILFQTLLRPDEPVYVEQLCLDITGPLRLSAFEQAWRETATHNPSLRTVFDWQGERPIQVVLRSVTPGWQVHDLNGVSATALQDSVDRHLDRNRLQAFDVAKGPLLRLALFCAGGDSFVLVISYHHLLLDGTSLRLVLEELSLRYGALISGRPAPMGGRPPYIAYAAWLTQRSEEESHAFWGPYLEGARSSPRVTRDGPGVGPGPVDCRDIVLPPGRVASIATAARLGHFSLAALLQAAWAVVLHDMTGTPRPVFGVTVSGRAPEVPGSDSMTGVFIRTVPVCVAVGADDRLAELVATLERDWLSIREHTYLPLKEIRQYIVADQAEDPFQSIVVIGDRPLLPAAPSGLKWGVRETHELTNYDFTVDVTLGDEIHLRLSSPRGAFLGRTLDRMIQTYGRVCAAADSPAVRVADLCSSGASKADDRSRLDGPAPPGRLSQRCEGRPSKQLLEAVLRVCSRALGLPRLSPFDNIFAAGCDSLGCVRVAVALEKVGHRVAIQEIYRSPTALGIASAICRAAEGAVMPSGYATVPTPAEVDPGFRETLKRQYADNIEDVRPTAPVQQAILQRIALEPSLSLYHDQSLIEVDQEINPEVFRGAWASVVRHHPALRTVFRATGGSPVQVSLRNVRVDIRQTDVAGASPAEREYALDQLKAADLAQGFDIERGPLLRIALLRLGDGRSGFLLSFHVLVMDGWCFAIVMQDFQEAYRALQRGKAPDLAARRPYRDFIDWIARQDYPASVAYWRSLVGSVEGTACIPRSSEKRQGREYTVASRARSIARGTVEQLGEFCRKKEITTNSFFQTAWAVLLHEISGGREHVLFGATVSGRPPELAGAEAMVGLFFNDIPIRVRVPTGESSFSDLARSVQLDFALSRRHEYVSMADVRGAIGLRADEDLFQTLLVFENYPKEAESALRTNASRYLREARAWRREVSDTDLTVYVELPPGAVDVRVAYLEGVLSEVMLSELLDRLERIVLQALQSDRIAGGGVSGVTSGAGGGER